MRIQRLGVAGVGALWLACVPAALGTEPPASRPEAGRAIDRRAVRDALEVAARIDQHVATRWAAREVRPTKAADDAEFARRVYLDVLGRIPRYRELSDFLEDPAPDKRARLVERLLDNVLYVNHFTAVWRSLLVPQGNNQQLRLIGQGIDAWLTRRIEENVGYDRLVRELLTAPIPGVATRGGLQPVPPAANPGEAPPVAFYQANEFKAENLAAATSRLFLGVKLECAQCHDHPFAKWTRNQFWEFAAFFSGIEPVAPNNPFQARPENPQRRDLAIPGTDKVVTAKFLEGPGPEWRDGVATRVVLADWLTSAGNPFFARAAANRMWAHFFGVGLIDPVDELGDDNPPSHPDLLDLLAREFADRGFDLKFLVRAITATRAYQLSSEATHASQDDLRSLGRMPIKGLTPEQLFDSLAAATGYRERGPVNPRALVIGGPGNPRGEFLNRFGGQDKRTEHQTSILQALALMNGRLVGDLTSSDLERSELFAAVVDAPFMDNAQRIETLYMMTLSRKPRANEMERIRKYVDGGGVSGDSTKALADVYWALLNSSEFILNH